jgi:hypothetical protein
MGRDNIINLDAWLDALSACEATDLLRKVLSNARAGCADGELPEEDRNALLSCLLGLASSYPAGECTVTYRSTQDAPEPVEVLRAVLDLALEGRGPRDGLCCIPHSCERSLGPLRGKTAPPERVQAAYWIGSRLN